MVERPDLARRRFTQGQSVPLFRSYAESSVLTDEVIRFYLQPLFSSPQRIEAFQRCWLGFDNTHIVAIHHALTTLQVPTLIVWGLQDFFFDKKWAYWLRDTISGAREVVEVEDARLFFPEDRPDSLTEPMLRFWNELERPRAARPALSPDRRVRCNRPTKTTRLGAQAGITSQLFSEPRTRYRDPH